jgi:hypothetical protein
MIMYTLTLAAVTTLSADDLSALKQTDTGFVSLSLSHKQLKHTSQEAYEAHEQRRLTSRHNTEVPPAETPSRRLDAAAPVEQSEADLFIGTGTHYANLYVGSPPQRVSVIIDTGSHHTAFPCAGASGCTDCGKHTDPYFNPDESSTSRTLTCADCPARKSSFLRVVRPARTTGQCDARADQCKFGQTYAEGSSWNAYQLRDNVWVGRHEATENSAAKLAAKSAEFQFGCINKQAGLFNGQVSNGIMGFGLSSGLPDPKSTLAATLHGAGVIDQKVFSMCFAKDGGSLTLGAPESDARLRKAGKPLRWVPLRPSASNWFTVEVTGVRVGSVKMAGGTSAFQAGKGTIVDSGTTDTYLPRAAAAAFGAAFEAASGMAFVGGKAYSLTAAQVAALPAIAFDLSGGEGQGGATVEMPASHYLDAVKPGTYRMRLYATESSGAILGANAMRDHDVVFDEENMRMGWVEADCHTPAVVGKSPTPAPAPATAAPATITTIAAPTAPTATATATVATAAAKDDSDAGFVRINATAFYGTAAVVCAALLLAAATIGYLLAQRRSAGNGGGLPIINGGDRGLFTIDSMVDEEYRAPHPTTTTTNEHGNRVSTTTLARSNNLLSEL